MRLLPIVFSSCKNTAAGGEEVLNGLDYILDLNEDPVYDNVEIIPDVPATGEPQSYEELAENDLAFRSNLCFIAFEIGSVYSEDEEIGIVGENRSATLYKAHVYYGFLSDQD